jgi:hypothetical protein
VFTPRRRWAPTAVLAGALVVACMVVIATTIWQGTPAQQITKRRHAAARLYAEGLDQYYGGDRRAAHYAWVASAWQHADPAFLPRWQFACNRLVALNWSDRGRCTTRP